MDARAKQRLTGAVILVALFVLFVPELLTGPRQAPPAEPADESGMRRYTIDLAAPQSSVQPSTPATPPQVKLPEIEQNRADAPPEPRALPGEVAVPAASPTSTAVSAAPPASAPVATAPPQSARPVPAPAAASVPATLPPRAEVPRVASIPPAADTAPARGGSFAVQLGTFENRENADRLVRDMTAKGFAAFLAPFKKDGRELYRVRVGPTRDRAAAEALAAQLKRVGQQGSVVSIS